ncbi:MAG TPA: hypothetical protein VK578_24495 [Edaphobacter sp.]|nr:hypothetical protein [Edaphobacter sp.]
MPEARGTEARGTVPSRNWMVPVGVPKGELTVAVNVTGWVT